MKKKNKRLTLDDIKYREALPPQLRQQALLQIEGNPPPDPTPNVEPTSCDGSLAKEIFAGNDSLCRIYIHNLRHKLADSDGISGKACIDGLVHGQILRDDSPKEVEWVRHTQEKISKKEKERTIIRVDVYE
jgi:hypothetical protein